MRTAVERLAIVLGCTALWADECLLRRPAQEEDRRGRSQEGDAQRAEAARAFGVGISSVKRYVAAYREGRSLAPKKRPGSRPKLDEGARKLLEADLEERPEATLPHRREFLRRVCGVSVSDSTVSRMLGRMGWTRKKDRWERRNAMSG